MRPSRAKTPAARAAGGLHPGILASKYTIKQNIYDLAIQVLGASWADETLQPLPEALPELLLGLLPGACSTSRYNLVLCNVCFEWFQFRYVRILV